MPHNDKHKHLVSEKNIKIRIVIYNYNYLIDLFNLVYYY